MTSLEENNLVVFYYFIASKIWIDNYTSELTFDWSGLTRDGGLATVSMTY